MKRHGKPTLLVMVYGDWLTVIGARDYRDILLNQSPNDEDAAQYNGYRILCDDTADMIEAYTEFHDRLKLKCFFAVEFKSEDKSIVAFAASGDGWSNDGPHCVVETMAPVSAVEAAAKEAIRILEGAIQ